MRYLRRAIVSERHERGSSPSPTRSRRGWASAASSNQVMIYRDQHGRRGRADDSSASSSSSRRGGRAAARSRSPASREDAAHASRARARQTKDNAFFWEGDPGGQAADPALHAKCRALRHPPGPMCPHCHASSGTRSRPRAAAASTASSWPTTRRSPPSSIRTAIALIELEEGTRWSRTSSASIPRGSRSACPSRSSSRRWTRSSCFPCSVPDSGDPSIRRGDPMDFSSDRRAGSRSATWRRQISPTTSPTSVCSSSRRAASGSTWRSGPSSPRRT